MDGTHLLTHEELNKFVSEARAQTCSDREEAALTDAIKAFDLAGVPLPIDLAIRAMLLSPPEGDSALEKLHSFRLRCAQEEVHFPHELAAIYWPLRIEQEPHNQDALQHLFLSLRALGRKIPPHYEEQSLKLILEDTPNDQQSQFRLHDVLLNQGKPVPDELRLHFLKHIVIEKIDPTKTLREIEEIYARLGLTFPEDPIKEFCVNPITAGKTFYCFALPKSASRNVISILSNARSKIEPIEQAHPQHDGGSDLAVSFEARFDYLKDQKGFFHSHAAPHPVTYQVIKRLRIPHLVTLRHPADHVAALYCHLRRLLQRGGLAEGAPPTNSSVSACAAIEDISRNPTTWHSVIQPVHREVFLDDIPVHDALTYLIRKGYLASALKWVSDWVALNKLGWSHIMRYEDLVADPNRELSRAYSYLFGETCDDWPPFEHDAEENKTIYPLGYSGIVGVWREYFSKKNVREFNEVVEYCHKCGIIADEVFKTYPNMRLKYGH